MGEIISDKYEKHLKEQMEEWLRQTRINAVRFGMPFISNPEKFVDDVFYKGV